MQLNRGARLGPYEVVDLVGSGGMGEVYRAMDTRLSRLVAIKILADRLADDPAAVERFHGEARAIAALSHPNILAIHEFNFAGDRPIVVTELLEGSPLRARMVAPIPWRKAFEIAAAIADGLSAAHARNVIHRDLKPENVFVTGEGLIKILDFGLAHFRQAAAADPRWSSAATDALTSHALGTLGYAAPEQLRGGRTGPAMDIFSLGVMLHEMIAGRNPFIRQSAAETIAAVLDSAPPPLANVPLAINQIVERCLEKDAAERFQSARDLSIRIREVLRDSDARTLQQSRTHRLLRISAAAVLSLVLSVAGVYVAVSRWNARMRAVKSVAVLPLTNTSNDASLDYLSDGLTETLINEISDIPQLRVTARPTAFRYKNQRIDPVRIGRDLGVPVFATGKVWVRGSSVTVQAKLIDAKNGSELWGGRYTRDRKDALSLTAQMAHDIAEKLGMSTPATEKEHISRSATTDALAYELYLKGLHALRSETPKDRPEAISYFQQAIEIDPHFARAYSGLAETYLRAANQTEAVLMRSKAREAVSRALQFDPDLAEAHASSGLLYMTDWNLLAAEQQFQKALQRNVSLATAHVMYSHMLRCAGRFDEALHHAQQAKELDPLSRGSSVALVTTRLYRGEIRAAQQELNRSLSMDPGFPTSHYLLAFSDELDGKPRQACAEYLRQLELIGSDSQHIDAVRNACSDPDPAKALANYHRQSIRFLLGDSRPGVSYEIAAHFAALGEKEKAFVYLGKAYEQRDSVMLLLNTDPSFRALRGDARFQDFVRGVGLVPTRRSAAAESMEGSNRTSAN